MVSTVALSRVLRYISLLGVRSTWRVGSATVRKVTFPPQLTVPNSCNTPLAQVLHYGRERIVSHSRFLRSICDLALHAVTADATLAWPVVGD